MSILFPSLLHVFSLLLPSSIFTLSHLSFSFSLSNMARKKCFLLLSPFDASTSLNRHLWWCWCELWSICENTPKYPQNDNQHFIPVKITFPSIFFCAITAPIPSLTLPFPPTNCSPSAVVSHWVFLLQLLALLRCQDIFNITKDKSFPVVSYTVK